MAPRTTPGRLGAMVAAALLAVAVVAYWTWHSGGSAKSELGVAGANADSARRPGA